MDNVDDIVLCNNEISSIIDFTTPNTDGNTTYNWTNDNTSIDFHHLVTGYFVIYSYKSKSNHRSSDNNCNANL